MAKLISAADQLCIKKTATVTEHPPFWKEHEVHVVLRLDSRLLAHACNIFIFELSLIP